MAQLIFPITWIYCIVLVFVLPNFARMALSAPLSQQKQTINSILNESWTPLNSEEQLALSIFLKQKTESYLEEVKQSRFAIDRVNDFLLKLWEMPDEYPENTELSSRIEDASNDFLLKLWEVPDEYPGNTELYSRIEDAGEDFEKGLDDDLNISSALKSLFELIEDISPLIEQQQVGSANRDQIVGLFANANQVLAVFEVEDPDAEDDNEDAEDDEDKEKQLEFEKQAELLEIKITNLEVSLRTIVETLKLIEKSIREVPAEYAQTGPLLWLTVAKVLSSEKENANELVQLGYTESLWPVVFDRVLPRVFIRILEPQISEILRALREERVILQSR